MRVISEPFTPEEMVITDNTETENVRVISEPFTPEEMVITDNTETIELKYSGEEWQGSGIENPDSLAIQAFLEGIVNLQGVVIEWESEEEPDLSLSLSNESQDLDIEIWYNESHATVSVGSDVFEVDSLPQAMEPFDSSFLQKPIELGVTSLREITFSDNEATYILNQETEMEEVETIPFISGWYFHGDFETLFSVEYYWMEAFVSGLNAIHGTETDEEVQETQQQITIKGEVDQDSLTIGQVVDDVYTLVSIESQDKTYRVPTQLVESYQFSPLDIVDNFIALIPLDAVESISIETADEQFELLVDRQFDSSEDGELNVEQTFYINENEIEEKVMRRNYQYLARLSYDDEATSDQIMGQEGVEADVTISYTYLNDGEQIQRIVRLIPYEESGKFLVENNEIFEFTMTDEKLNEMLKAFRALE